MWSIPVSPEEIARAREGDWSVVLTPKKFVPRSWFGEIAGKDLLGLASGGGQQCPLFAAAGARVTSFDASDAQLGRDAEVAAREGLHIQTVQGYMDDLSVFPDESFDLIFHPVSNCFAPEVVPVWRECARVLRPGGALLAGLCNPLNYIFDMDAQERGEMIVRHKLPYADTDLPPAEVERLIARDHTLEFSHTLETQIGGQLAAGLMLTDLFEDGDSDPPRASAAYFQPFLATRAIRPIA
nr:class I SAM-dependent methyltransferase [Sphingobium nicotianae]